MSPTPCRHGDPLEAGEAPIQSDGICGASKETGPFSSIVMKTIEHQHLQRNSQQHPQVAGDSDVAQATTTSSSSSWRFRRTRFDARTSVIDLDKSKAAAPADLAADAGTPPSPTPSSRECTTEMLQYLVPSATRYQRERADTVGEPHFDAPVPESMVRPHSSTGVERCSLRGTPTELSPPYGQTSTTWPTASFSNLLVLAGYDYNFAADNETTTLTEFDRKISVANETTTSSTTSLGWSTTRPTITRAPLLRWSLQVYRPDGCCWRLLPVRPPPP